MSSLKHLIAEIHRLSLWKVVGLYLAASWVAYQVVLGLTDGVGLPDWVPGAALALLVVGLPIVLATAVVQDSPPPGPLAAAPDPAGAATPDASPAPGAAAEDRSARDPAPAIADATAGAAAPPSLRRLLTWRRSILGGVLAFAALGAGTTAYMAMREMGIGPVGTLLAQGVLDEGGSIILADFDSPTGDTVLAAVVVQALRVDLGQSAALSIAEPVRVREALGRMRVDPGTRLTPELARQVAIREGFRAQLQGTVASAGRFLITVDLVSADSARTLASFRETARDSTELIPAVDRLAAQIRERVGESLKTIRARPPLEAVTTASLEALRDYTLAQRALDAGDDAKGITLLEAAVSVDTAFAMAYRRLGTVYWNHGDQSRSLAMVRTALAHSQRLTERERLILTAGYALSAGRWADAAAAYERVLDTYPDDQAALNNLGLCRLALHDYAGAETAFQAALRAGSRFGGIFNNLVDTRIARGDTAGARKAIDALARMHPDSRDVAVNTAELESSQERYVEAARLVDAAGLPPGVNANVRARFALARGRLEEAGRLRSEAVDAWTSGGDAAVAFGVELEGAFVDLWTLGRPAEAVAAADRLQARLPLDSLTAGDRPYLPLALLYAEAGQPGRARALLDAWRGEVDPDLRGSGGWLEDVVRGVLLLDEGRGAEAAASLRRGGAAAPFPMAGLPELAEALAAGGDEAGAVDAYERYLSTPAGMRGGMVPFLSGALWTAPYRAVPAHERLAALYLARGDTANAARHYAHLVELWTDADPALQPRVQAARRRLQALTAEP